MKLIYNIYELDQYISQLKAGKKTIGFVPTMGALHEGHASLLEQARTENDICICSIFVNPVQFNNSDDLKNYPRSLSADIQILERKKVDALFAPSESEIYPEIPSEKYDLGGLDEGMEGKFRPGHFNGVVIIVKKLFDLIKPDKAYFGTKDFQQVVIIKHMVKRLKLPVEIIECQTIREGSGLAMSSRNQRLTMEERNSAAIINKKLIEAREKLLKENQSIQNVKEWLNTQFCSGLYRLEYFEIVDSETLLPAIVLSENRQYTACIAVYVGEVRLIDNIKIL